MKIDVAESAGFCFGVKRAVSAVYEKTEQELPVYTFGPIIHNEEVTGELAQKGVKCVEDIESLSELPKGYLFIMSHGVSREIFNKMNNSEHLVIDATCPFVKKIHNIVEKESGEGKTILVAGDPAHPEVSAIVGWSLGETHVLETTSEAEAFEPVEGREYILVSQTTFNTQIFQEIVEILKKKVYNVSVMNTICSATEVRQREACEMARSHDAMIVIGGTNSSNTRKLFEICKQQCASTYFIQKPINLDLNELKSFCSVGITAGASTPNKIIQEVLTVMEESFAQLMEESFKTVHTGQVVEGTVISVKEDEIILNIGYKSDATISRAEYTNTPNVDLTKVVNVGDTLNVKILKVDDREGQVIASYKRLAAERSSKVLEEAFNNKTVLKAPVTEVLNGGLIVEVDETRIFIPASLVSDAFEKDLSKYNGQEIEFVLTEFNPKRRRVIGDRKQLVSAVKEEKKKELLGKIAVGDVVEGVVKNVTDFGAFVDIGGIDGLLHISEMSWGRIESPKKTFKSGDNVRAFIKEITGEKIALSMKFADQNPWANADEDFAIGNVITGKVARMTDFGAFIEIVPGVDALLHVSQISTKRIEKPADVLKVGQEITAAIVDFNYDEKKISLSMRALEKPEEGEEVAEAVEEVPAE
ncbi:MAG: bifunctional 4-hydroxy-3-methylbut-2-enyl diphosphate reductase/30S ribosomal protein S1 [Lachnospiraceae bacterium]|nr:bifunctional 4-hydroxy-3-methylbut-2-enyl diphosphate reductase/30S ribosomal protein S1 [Lachnospiraceae bacterium]